MTKDAVESAGAPSRADFQPSFTAYQLELFAGSAPPLETSAVLPDGTPIEGPGDIKAFLMKNPSMFTRCLTTKLIENASGRELSAREARVIEEIVAAEPENGYGFQDLLQAVVQSAVFLAE